MRSQSCTDEGRLSANGPHPPPWPTRSVRLRCWRPRHPSRRRRSRRRRGPPRRPPPARPAWPASTTWMRGRRRWRSGSPRWAGSWGKMYGSWVGLCNPSLSAARGATMQTRGAMGGRRCVTVSKTGGHRQAALSPVAAQLPGLVTGPWLGATVFQLNGVCSSSSSKTR